MDTNRKYHIAQMIEREAIRVVERECYGQPALEAIDSMTLQDLAPFRAAIRLFLDNFNAKWEKEMEKVNG